MIIFLGIVLELVTVIGSAYTCINSAINYIIDVGNKGFKFNMGAVKNCGKDVPDLPMSINFFTILLLFIPGINLIFSEIESIKLKKYPLNKLIFKEIIIPMTKKEYENFEKMEDDSKKIKYIAFITNNEKNEEEFVGFLGNKMITTTITAEKLNILEKSIKDIKESGITEEEDNLEEEKSEKPAQIESYSNSSESTQNVIQEGPVLNKRLNTRNTNN